MPRAFDPEDMLSLPLMANLATVEDNQPRNAPVWFAWEAGILWMLGSESGSSTRRILGNPEVAVEIVHYDNDEGILLHLGMRGRAEVVRSDPDMFRRLLDKYLGPDQARWNAWFIENIARIDDPSGRMIRLEPESIFTNNVSYYRTGPRLTWPPNGPE